MSDNTEAGPGHNKPNEGLAEIITEYSESLARSAEENDTRSALRKRAEEEFGIPSKAVQDGVSRLRQSLKKQEGYDDGMAAIKEAADAVGGAKNLFSWVVEQQEAKKKAREEAKAKRAAAKEQDEAEEQRDAA